MYTSNKASKSVPSKDSRIPAGVSSCVVDGLQNNLVQANLDEYFAIYFMYLIYILKKGNFLKKLKEIKSRLPKYLS